ncbi:AtpZ/AtpI family protein [Chryseobacterium sp. SNU WT5]|uniref:AtpZ/AtpI family protein n=1 Tax=Chryseobacterium sp. SNU WT5 TaxID=2594269 RepID=UPI00117F9E4D|nr:AtpZ/AtpI family protein [Chryseobacterium sp. SNU WT5]QDP86378.1 AtpZ/AtpI family protein [Chryseobacterium sp. SNU WT5]
MAEEDFNNDKEVPINTEKKASWGMRQYGVYSTVVFQILATMGLAFWGGKKINDYFEVKSNLLTLAIGLTGMALAFYNLLRQLKEIQKDEK